MKIIIADAEISLIPDDWMNNKKIQLESKQKGRIPLIDGARHQHFLKNLDPLHRYDRPDILHFGLLTALGYAKMIQTFDLYFTCKTGSFHIESDTRLPRSQPRFYGILEQLLSNTYSGKLITKVSSVLKTENHNPNVYFSQVGKRISIENLLNLTDTFVFGGFAHGYFRTPPRENDLVVSLSDESLDLWTAISMFLAQVYHLI